MRRLFLISLLCSMAVLAGCGTKMPLQSDAEKLAADAPPIYLLAVDVKNNYKPRYQPAVRSVTMYRHKPDGKVEPLTFAMDGKGIYYGENEDQAPRYLVRLQLEPGRYTLSTMLALGRAFPINGTFYVPLHAPLVAAGSGVTYLGAVSAVVRERQDNEFRAGPPIPLIDQAIAGASGGTFDVSITDRYADDVAAFRAVFPALRTVEIGKAILPPFDRTLAQAAWEGK